VQIHSCPPYVITFVSDLRQVGGFLRVLRFPPHINIVESGVNNHQTNKQPFVSYNIMLLILV